MKFCYNNSNLARQVPRNDRLWWFIAALLTVFLLFINKNMADSIPGFSLSNAGIGQAGFQFGSNNQYYDPESGTSNYYDSFGNIIKKANAGEPTITDYMNKSLSTGVGGAYPQPNPNLNTNTNINANSGTSFDSIYASMYPGWDRTAAEQDWISKGRPTSSSSSGGQSLNDYMRGQIEGGYNDYFSKLNDLYGGLNTQGQAQENIAQNSYNQSIKDLLANKQSSLGDIGLSEQKLQANQVKNLRDIGSNIQNQYMAGNVMLGARGAGDSSAANQYSYALNRIGSKERGNVMNQTAQSQAELENQKAKLNNIVTQETSRLDTEFANVKQQISSWLAEQQNAIKQMIAEGTLKKSQDIANATTSALNTALSLYQNKVAEVNNKKTQLEKWAFDNATNISQLKNNMASITSQIPNMPTANAVNGGVQVDSQGNLRSLFGYGTSNEDKLTY